MNEVKASQRNDRRGSCQHNIKDEARAKLNYINHERTKLNQYYVFDTNEQAKRVSGKFDIKEYELKKYEHYYGAGQQAQNERHIRNRQKKRCRTTDDIYKSKKTRPMESIFQFSKASDGLDPTLQAKVTLKAFYDTLQMLQRNYGDNFKPLDFSLHMDETSCHIHSRATFGSFVNGYFVPNQTKALQEMGFGIPDPNRPKDRYNNELISFTDFVREHFYVRCEVRAKELGLDITIDREVRTPSQRHKDRLAHEVESLTQSVADLQAQIQQKDKRLSELNELLLSANKRVAKGIKMTDEAHTFATDKAIQMLEQAKTLFKGVQNDLNAILEPETDEFDLSDLLEL